MDFTPVIAQLWGVLSWAIPVLLLITLFKSPWAKGHIGELLVRVFAHWRLDRHIYRVTLNTPDGTTQIDHVFLSVHGIFVLETKNMSGWIFGTEQQAQWTQKFPRRSFKFQNPLRQNYKHLKALEATLSVSPAHLHSVITFVGGSTFKTAMPANVTRGIGFIRYIKSFRQAVFSETEVDGMLQALKTGRLAPSVAATQALNVVARNAAVRWSFEPGKREPISGSNFGGVQLFRSVELCKASRVLPSPGLRIEKRNYPNVCRNGSALRCIAVTTCCDRSVTSTERASTCSNACNCPQITSSGRSTSQIRAKSNSP
jgi:restriction system protein